MAERVLHDATQRMLEAFILEPAHALCLSGDVGAGLGTVARTLAERLSGSSLAVTVISPEKGLIPIDRVRQLYGETRAKQTGRRCIIIDDADRMSAEAQNALLKLLEEPVENVHFILTSHHLQALLPTIRSRLQVIAVRPIDETASIKLLSQYLLNDVRQRQILFLAAGKPAELVRLAGDEEYFKARVEVVSKARSFLEADTYGRLIAIKSLTDRAGALSFLTTCADLLTYGFIRQHNLAASQGMDELDEAMERIESGGHVRTQLLHVVTKLP